jgi:hypothetical protein
MPHRARVSRGDIVVSVTVRMPDGMDVMRAEITLYVSPPG